MFSATPTRVTVRGPNALMDCLGASSHRHDSLATDCLAGESPGIKVEHRPDSKATSTHPSPPNPLCALTPPSPIQEVSRDLSPPVVSPLQLPNIASQRVRSFSRDSSLVVFTSTRIVDLDDDAVTQTHENPWVHGLGRLTCTDNRLVPVRGHAKLITDNRMAKAPSFWADSEDFYPISSARSLAFSPLQFFQLFQLFYGRWMLTPLSRASAFSDASRPMFELEDQITSSHSDKINERDLINSYGGNVIDELDLVGLQVEGGEGVSVRNRSTRDGVAPKSVVGHSELRPSILLPSRSPLDISQSISGSKDWELSSWTQELHDKIGVPPDPARSFAFLVTGRKLQGQNPSSRTSILFAITTYRAYGMLPSVSVDGVSRLPDASTTVDRMWDITSSSHRPPLLDPGPCDVARPHCAFAVSFYRSHPISRNHPLDNNPNVLRTLDFEEIASIADLRREIREALDGLEDGDGYTVSKLQFGGFVVGERRVSSADCGLRASPLLSTLHRLLVPSHSPSHLSPNSLSSILLYSNSLDSPATRPRLGFLTSTSVDDVPKSPESSAMVIRARDLMSSHRLPLLDPGSSGTSRPTFMLALLAYRGHTISRNASSYNLVHVLRTPNSEGRALIADWKGEIHEGLDGLDDGGDGHSVSKKQSSGFIIDQCRPSFAYRGPQPSRPAFALLRLLIPNPSPSSHPYMIPSSCCPLSSQPSPTPQVLRASRIVFPDNRLAPARGHAAPFPDNRLGKALSTQVLEIGSCTKSVLIVRAHKRLEQPRMNVLEEMGADHGGKEEINEGWELAAQIPSRGPLVVGYGLDSIRCFSCARSHPFAVSLSRSLSSRTSLRPNESTSTQISSVYPTDSSPRLPHSDVYTLMNDFPQTISLYDSRLGPSLLAIPDARSLTTQTHPPSPCANESRHPLLNRSREDRPADGLDGLYGGSFGDTLSSTSSSLVVLVVPLDSGPNSSFFPTNPHDHSYIRDADDTACSDNRFAPARRRALLWTDNRLEDAQSIEDVRARCTKDLSDRRRSQKPGPSWSRSLLVLGPRPSHLFCSFPKAPESLPSMSLLWRTTNRTSQEETYIYEELDGLRDIDNGCALGNLLSSNPSSHTPSLSSRIWSALANISLEITTVNVSVPSCASSSIVQLLTFSQAPLLDLTSVGLHLLISDWTRNKIMPDRVVCNLQVDVDRAARLPRNPMVQSLIYWGVYTWEPDKCLKLGLHPAFESRKKISNERPDLLGFSDARLPIAKDLPTSSFLDKPRCPHLDRCMEYLDDSTIVAELHNSDDPTRSSMRPSLPLGNPERDRSSVQIPLHMHTHLSTSHSARIPVIPTSSTLISIGDVLLDVPGPSRSKTPTSIRVWHPYNLEIIFSSHRGTEARLPFIIHVGYHLVSDLTFSLPVFSLGSISAAATLLMDGIWTLPTKQLSIYAVVSRVGGATTYHSHFTPLLCRSGFSRTFLLGGKGGIGISPPFRGRRTILWSLRKIDIQGGSSAVHGRDLLSGS